MNRRDTRPIPAVVALLYRRVSTEDQARDGLSLDTQTALTRQYAARNGWAIGGEFEDVLTGTRADRPRYQALLAAVAEARPAGRTVVVVVSRLDRFGRSVFERARCTEGLRTHGVRVHSVAEGGELPELVEHLLAAVAEEEVRRLSEAGRAARAYVAAGGWHYPTRAGWGYARRVATAAERAEGAPHSVLVVDPATARHVRTAWRMAEDGASVNAIARWVQSLPPEARGHRRMSYRMVRQMLSAPVYVARQAHGDADVLARPAARWPALVTDERWRRVQERLALNRAPPGVWVQRYLLSGLLRCPRCGSPMAGRRNVVNTTPNWHRQPQYGCIGHNLGTTDGLRCHETTLMPAVDAAVVHKVTMLLKRAAGDGGRDPDDAADASMIQESREVPDTFGNHTLDQAERRRWTNAALRFVDGRIGRATYEGLRDAVAAHAPKPAAQTRDVSTPPRNTAPRRWFEAVRLARDWAEATGTCDLDLQRRVIAELVGRVVPVRVRRGEYRVDIAWTALALAIRPQGQ